MDDWQRDWLRKTRDLLRGRWGALTARSEAFAAARALVNDEAPLTEYRSYAEQIKRLAPKLDLAVQKELAFVVVGLGRLVSDRPWEHLPEGYVPEGLIMARVPNGARRESLDHDARVARLYLLPIYANALNVVVINALQEAAWSLEDLENLLDESGGPFPDFFRFDYGWVRKAAYGVKNWPWGVWAFAERLADHETEPGFEDLLRRFLTEVFVWTYQIVGGTSVSRTLDLASRHEGCARLLFERLEAIEEERRAFLQRIDRERVENSLRFGLSAQILNLTGRDGKTVPEAWVPDEDGALERAMQAIGCRGVDEYLVEVDRKHDDGLSIDISPPRGNLFTGAKYSYCSLEQRDEYVERIEGIANHPPERPGSPRISSEDFLGHFDVGQLERQYFHLEDPYPLPTAARWRKLWLATGRDPEVSAALLGVLSAFPLREVRSGPPPEWWWERWRAAIHGLDGEVVRRACEAVWSSAGDGKTSFNFPGSIMFFQYFELLEQLEAAVIWGASEVATPEICSRLADVALYTKTFPEELPLQAIRSLERAETPAARQALRSVMGRSRRKPVRRWAMEALRRAAAYRGKDPEVMLDGAADITGMNRDGVRVWRSIRYEAWARLEDDGAVRHGYRDPATGGVARSLAREAYEADPETPREVLLYVRELQRACGRQRSRLEAAMLSARAWTTADWREIFVENPLMNNLARRLIWYLRHGASQILAMPGVDGEWKDECGEPVRDGWREARLMHPLYAPDEDLTGWRRHISEKGIVQPFEQASRAAYAPHEEKLGLREVQRLETRGVPGFDELSRRWNVDFRRPPYQAFALKSYPEFGQRAFYSIQADPESPAADYAPAASVWFVPIAVSLWDFEEVRESALRIRDVHPMVFSETLRDLSSLFA